MSTIIVIGTFHTEDGACTSEELLKIIQKVSPEVIFCEASPEDLPKMLKATENFNTPEIKVIRELLIEARVRIVPVDIFGDPFNIYGDSSDQRYDLMNDLFIKKMKNYKNALLVQSDETYSKGYKFLNSKTCDQINFDKRLMEREIVTNENNKELSLYYSNWVKFNDYREHYWIKSIHHYLQNSKVNEAILMVGAAHRIGLMNKIMELKFKNQLNLKWNFDYLNY